MDNLDNKAPVQPDLNDLQAQFGALRHLVVSLRCWPNTALNPPCQPTLRPQPPEPPLRKSRREFSASPLQRRELTRHRTKSRISSSADIVSRSQDSPDVPLHAAG